MLQCTFPTYLRNQYDCTPPATSTAVVHEGTSALPKTDDTLVTTGPEDTFQFSKDASLENSLRSDSKQALFEAFSRFHAEYMKASVGDNSERPVEDSSEGDGLNDSASDPPSSNSHIDVAGSDVLQVIDQ